MLTTFFAVSIIFHWLAGDEPAQQACIKEGTLPETCQAPDTPTSHTFRDKKDNTEYRLYVKTATTTSEPFTVKTKKKKPQAPIAQKVSVE